MISLRARESAPRFQMQTIVAPLHYYRYHDRSLISRYSREDGVERFNLVRRRNRIALDRTNDHREDIGTARDEEGRE